MMSGRSLSLRTAIISSVIAIGFFLFKDKEDRKTNYIFDKNDGFYRYLELNEDNIDEIKTGRWKVLVLRTVDQKWVEKVREDIKKINMAVLEIDSFSKTKLATIFRVKELPEEVLVVEGTLDKNKMLFVDLKAIDIWRAFEIQLLLLYLRAYVNFNDALKIFLQEGLSFLDRVYSAVPFFHGVVICF